MADGDVLHSGLAWRYQHLYRQLCEGVVSDEELARGIGERIKRDVKEDYERLTSRMRAVKVRLEQLSEAVQARQEIEWSSVGPELGRMCGGSGSKRNNALLAQAARSVANDIAEGSPVTDAAQSLSRSFLEGLYKSRFGGAVVTTDEHFGSVAPAEIERRLERVEPHVMAQLDHIGKQVARAKEGAKPRLGLLPHKPKKIADLDSSLDDLWT